MLHARRQRLALHDGKLTMADQKKRKHRRTGKPSVPPFQPTAEQRRFVSVMSGMRMTADDICKVLGSGRKGRTGPMSKTCLYRHFKHELESGMACLHFKVASKLRDAIEAGAPCALMMAARNMARFQWDRYNHQGLPLIAGDSEKTIQVEFLFPSSKPQTNGDDGRNGYPGGRGSAPTIDAYANKPADLSLKALEPPRPRTTTGTGAVYEQPREPCIANSRTGWHWLVLLRPRGLLQVRAAVLYSGVYSLLYLSLCCYLAHSPSPQAWDYRNAHSTGLPYWSLIC
jgi:hypothetical protein